MTQQAELMNSINKLPPQYFREVIDFVGYLQHKTQNSDKPLEFKAEETPKGRRGFGCAKGQIWMADDFDAPLEDFKDYM